MNDTKPQPRRGLGLRLYVILTRPTDKGGDRDKLRAEHRAFIDDLEARGILFAAGPEVDAQDRPQGSGIIIIRATSLDAAKQIADAEPFHRAGYREYDIRTWRVSEGSFRLSVRLTEQTLAFE